MAPPVLHGAAATVTGGAGWEPVSSGHRSTVWHACFEGDRADVAVKTPSSDHEPGTPERDEAAGLIHAEAARLVWLEEHLQGRGIPSPQVVAAPEPDDPDPILVTSWVEGVTDPRLLRSPETAVTAFATALASLHEASRRIDLDACPFDASLEVRLGQAARRVAAGLVDAESFGDLYRGYRPEELLERVHQMAAATNTPGPDDRVLVHGDLCVTNIIFDPAYGSTVGALDWPFAGVGDRISDLAVTARSLSRNLSGEVLPDFFAAYGLAEPDLLRLETSVALEELL